MHATGTGTQAIEALIQAYPTDPSTVYEYGTAGFRMRADRMIPVAFRVGLFMASLDESRAIGVMLTASHNPVADNGIKLVAASGEMMEDVEEEISQVCNMTAEELKAWAGNGTPKTVLVGRDTRPSGPALFKALSDGLQGMSIVDCGEVTTPQLHHYVRSWNQIPGCTVEQAQNDYFAMLSNGFNSIVPVRAGKVDLVIDCANGVGANTMAKMLNSSKLNGLSIQLVNTGDGVLNHECGADFVKLYQKASNNAHPVEGTHYASFDGDADRVVFFYFNNGQFRLLDGDRIAVLIAETFKRLTDEAKIEASIGVVQTAYANGASTKHIRSIGIKSKMTCTGVKNLHHEAKHFDIGVYFEANGHGTVLFSTEFKKKVKGKAERIQQLMSLINECVGDAISDLLVVEAILSLRGLSLEQWESAYTELPSVQLKIPVPNRSKFVTTNADQTLLEPAGIQSKIDALVGEVEGARAFVRPSGTEDIVRVYAEASKDPQLLAQNISDIVKNFF